MYDVYVRVQPHTLTPHTLTGMLLFFLPGVERYGVA